MKVRALITLLLVLSLGATHAAAGARFAEREAPQRLAPEEEREAREFAAAFLRRLEEERDLAPLVRELFVGDFAERLHASVSTTGSLYFLDRLAAAEASREEVLRYHVAVNNLLLLTSLYAAAQETKPGGAAGEADLKSSNVLPPDVRELLRDEPLLARFMPARFAPEGGAASRAGDAAEFITTVGRLRALTSTIERANVLLRSRLTREQTRRAFVEWRRAAGDEGATPLRPQASVVGKDWYGYPAGTRLVCVTLLLFHVELVRVGGAYKVLSVYLNDD